MCFPFWRLNFQFFKILLPIFQDFSNFFKCANTILAQGPVRGPMNTLVKALSIGLTYYAQNMLRLLRMTYATGAIIQEDKHDPKIFQNGHSPLLTCSDMPILKGSHIMPRTCYAYSGWLMPLALLMVRWKGMFAKLSVETTIVNSCLAFNFLAQFISNIHRI